MDFMRDAVFTAAQKSPGSAFSGVERQFLSFVGREDLYYAAQKPRRTCIPAMSAGQPIDPLEVILDRAKRARLVAINEAHDDPQSRSFIADVVERLHTAGFSYYAAETFNLQVPQEAPWPRPSDGYYVGEPTFGTLMRRVRTLNFTLVPYEDTRPLDAKASMADQVNARELRQAENLNERLVSANPKARTIIHVGYGHLYETEIAAEFGTWKPMGYQLKRLSGVDPLTVDQTRFRSPILTPIVCALPTAEDGKPLNGTDMVIALPEVTFKSGRPAWRQARGQRAVTFYDRLPIEDWSIIEARFASDGDDAVPVDRLLLGPGEKLPLLLPPGAFRIEAWSRDGVWSKPAYLNVQ